MKIIIIQTAFIGDIVLATPIIEKLKSEYPKCHIDFLARKGNELLFEGHPKLNRVLVFDKKNKYKELIRLVKEIRSESYDYVINVQRFFTTGLITALSGGRIKIGFGKNPMSFFFTKRYKHIISTKAGIHEIDRNLSLIQTLTNKKKQKPMLYPSERDMQVVPKGHEYICIAPASNWLTKQFTLDKWCELVHRIPKHYIIYLIGGKQDIALCEKIKAETDDKKIKIFAGKLSFLESAALIQQAKMTYTNDSAPLHFASAMNAPVTAIFCSTIPEFGFGPLSDNSVTVETDTNLPCRPCGLHGKKKSPKKHFKCSDIEIEKILTKSNIV